jgi:pimeloyl-ACP methyl ester carboxylesterase
MDAPATDPTIRPYRIAIPQADLDELQHRLAETRLPNALPGVGWSYGVPNEYVVGLLDRWRTAFDWRAFEARINAKPQFTTTIDGQQIHFLHIRSAASQSFPLILTHGWPGSFVEYLDVIGPLTDPAAHGADPADAFDLVIPSIPGFTLSGPTSEPGWNRHRVARAWVELMRRLGYDRYGAVGNDAGSFISPEVGRIAPEQTAGVHVTQIFSFPSGDPAEFEGLSDDDQAALAFLQRFSETGLAFNQLQSTQPQTLAFALADSPAGQLAWSGQLFGDAVDPDFALTNVALYWLTGTTASSMRFYYEDAHAAHPTEPTTVPIGLSQFGGDFQSIRRFAERDHRNIVSWKRHDRGGHYAAHAAPDLLVVDIRQFFRPLRSR